jgi:hypothetical protein
MYKISIVYSWLVRTVAYFLSNSPSIIRLLHSNIRGIILILNFTVVGCIPEKNIGCEQEGKFKC